MKERTLRPVVLIAWAAFFVWLLVSGEVHRYIGPRTQWVVVFGALSLTVAACAFWSLRRRVDPRAGRGLAIMLLPIAAVLIVPRPSLGSLAASRKLGGGPAVALQPGNPDGDEPVSFKHIEYASESEEYAAVTGIVDGLPVELTGFVTHQDDGIADFSLTRFSIFCCAADVVPHLVPVDADRDYADDVWLHIEGVLEHRDGVFVVVARDVEEVPEPEDPYLR